MRKTLATLLSVAAIAAPLAHAGDQTITVGLTYDPALLQTESGAELVLESLERQAIEACTYASPIIGTLKHDRTCSTDLVEQAVDEIRRVSHQEGTVAASVFASVESGSATPAQ
ncbi:MAG: UrcA family protein [Pseudomonadota bacterium]